jgi:hypothetical protein
VAVAASKQAAVGAEAQAVAEAAMLAALELLLARGCSVAAADTVGGAGLATDTAGGRMPAAPAGETVLHVAAEWLTPAGIRLLLNSAHAGTASLTLDGTGARPLDRALTAGRADNARLLLTQLRKVRRRESTRYQNIAALALEYSVSRTLHYGNARESINI